MAGETPQMKTTLESSEKTANSNAAITEGGWPHYNGVPMVKISCAAAELVPTVQYGNATIGPVQVTCFMTPDGQLLFDPESAKSAVALVRALCEEGVAEDRQTVQVLMRSRIASGESIGR